MHNSFYLFSNVEGEGQKKDVLLKIAMVIKGFGSVSPILLAASVGRVHVCVCALSYTMDMTWLPYQHNHWFYTHAHTNIYCICIYIHTHLQRSKVQYNSPGTLAESPMAVRSHTESQTGCSPELTLLILPPPYPFSFPSHLPLSIFPSIPSNPPSCFYLCSVLLSISTQPVSIHVTSYFL